MMIVFCFRELVHFLGHLADAMHKAKKSLILVIPPAVQARYVVWKLGI